MGQLNLMVLSGDYSKIHAAAMVTMVAGSLGQTVDIFVSMEALPAFHQDAAVRETIVKGPVARDVVEKSHQDYLTLFEQAKDMGDVHMYACSLVADVKEWSLSDLSPVFDDMMGVTGFLGKAQEGTSLTF
jgi:peroxiredoxin family protein